MHGPEEERLSRALSVLDPPPVEREKWRKRLQSAFEMQRFLSSDERDELEIGIGSRQGKAALARYIRALREMRASYTALNASIQRFLALEASDIEHDIVEAGAMLNHKGPRPRKRPANRNARTATELARSLLSRPELTTERKGKWHTLTQFSPTPAAIYDITWLPH